MHTNSFAGTSRRPCAAARLSRAAAAVLPGVVAALALSGCATIFTGTKDTLTFHSNVPGVRLTIDGQFMGELPLTIALSRNFVGGRQFLAKFERDGYVVQQFTLQREFNPVAVLDVTSIPTSGGIDVLTGSIMRFAPAEYHVQMLAEGASAGSSEFRRAVALHAFALASYGQLKRDLARGGGEHLSALAGVLCGAELEAAALLEGEALREAQFLLGASGPHELVLRLERVVAGSEALRPCRT